MKRKTFLHRSAAVIGGSLLPALVVAADEKRKPLRIAHLTDIHVKPGNIPEAGMAKALQQVQGLNPKVDCILNGGDAIMDALEADKPKVQTQWNLFKQILQKENSLPVYHTIGNHDIWGWFIKKDKPESDRLYGKQWAMEELGMEKRYYRFTRANWHFIILDSVQLNPAGGYIGKLDADQLAWLQEELKAVPAEEFICIVSHIPVLSICSGLFFDKTEANGDLLIKRNLMHTDYLSLKKIFRNYPQIRCCISGHIHLQDELEYLGITYYCNGAVSGNWWGGSFQEFAPAYALMEFYPDGRHRRTMINY